MEACTGIPAHVMISRLFTPGGRLWDACVHSKYSVLVIKYNITIFEIFSSEIIYIVLHLNR